MGLFKKYPVFSSVLAVFVLIFLGGATMTYMAAQRAGKAEKKYKIAKQSLSGTLALSPAPVAENVAASLENIESLKQDLTARIETTKGTSQDVLSADPPESGTQMLFQLEALKDEYMAEAKRLDDDKTIVVTLPEDFYFGFSRFLKSGTPPDDEYIPDVFKQKELLNYILRKLFRSPDLISVSKIERKSVVKTEPVKGRRANEGTTYKDEFTIDSAISAAKEGAVETMPFRITFNGYTTALRSFLKQLSEFELPLVVRSVEVSPAEVKKEKDRGSSRSNKRESASTSPFDIFDQLEGGASEDTAEVAPAAIVEEPVVEETESQFVVTIEYIEVLPPNLEPKDDTFDDGFPEEEEAV